MWSGSIILSVSGTFKIVAYNASSCTTNVGANTQSRIQIVATTAGASGGTVNATTTSNTLGNITI